SRSGGMATEISNSLTAAGFGQSTTVSIGGDAIIGSTYAELMPFFEADPETHAIVIYSEPGGPMEAQLAEWVKANNSRLPMVAFIHGPHMGDTYRPLMAEPALKDYRFIGYHRRGYAGSGRPDGPLSVSEHAADCLALLRKLDAAPGHVVGHSSGAVIGIQLALDAPDAVRSLTLLEPAL